MFFFVVVLSLMGIVQLSPFASHTERTQSYSQLGTTKRRGARSASEHVTFVVFPSPGSR